MVNRSGTAETATWHGAHAPSTTWILACLGLSTLLPSLGTSIANVALPTLASAFGATFPQVQWVVLAYLLANTALLVGAGRLGDAIGRRRLLVTGIVVFTAASMLCGVAPSLWLLVAARAVQGLGAAIMLSLAMALVGDTVPKERTGSAMGMLGTMSAIGTALGPSLGGMLIAWLGWRAIFLVNAPLGVLALVLACRHLPADPHLVTARSSRFDAPGTLLLALALVAYALAMTIGRGSLAILLLLVAAAGGALFVSVEARAASPLVRLASLRDPALRASLAMNGLVSTVMMATLVVGPFHLARALGLAPALVGIVMSIGPIAAALTGLPAGRLVDRRGTPGMTIAGLTTLAAGTLAVSVTPTTWGIAGFVCPIIAVTVGYAVFQAANNTAVMAGVAHDQRGVTSGMLGLSRNLGLITGASAMGSLFAIASGATDPTAPGEAIAAGMRITFVVATGVIATALGIAVSRRSPVPVQA
jgi:MFS family permease